MKQNENHGGDLKRTINGWLGLAQCISLIAEVWLRAPGTTGTRFFSGQFWIAMALLLVVAAFSYNPVMMQFWVATGCWWVMHKFAQTMRQRKRLPMPHSRFVGISLLSFMGGNYAAQRFWEPLGCFIAGYMLIESGRGYGGSIVVLAVCLFVSASYTAASERAQLNALHDAREDQRRFAEEARKHS